MTESMTAFARCEKISSNFDAVWELRSVNHRFLEVQFRLPDNSRALEPALRERLKARLSRGKLDCILQLRQGSQPLALDVDDALLERLSLTIRSIAERTGATQPVSAVELLRWPGVLREAKIDTDALQSVVLEAFDGALEKLQDARVREGAELSKLLVARTRTVEELIALLQRHLPELRAAQRRRIEERIAELNVEIDQQRLEQELVYFAQRSDVDEELDRLSTHLVEVRRVLAGDGPCGRRLDFLMQELNREANTLGSKASGLTVSKTAIDIKVLIEQMREQVQNIE